MRSSRRALEFQLVVRALFQRHSTPQRPPVDQRPRHHRYQSALLTEELQAIFSFARPAPRTLLEDRVKSAYEVATGKKKVEQGEQDGPVKKRIPQEGDSCPICCTFGFFPVVSDEGNKPLTAFCCSLADEDFEPGAEKGLVFCLTISGCGNALHAECFSNWAKTSNPT